MRPILFFAIFCISWPAYSAPPEIMRITYPIEGNRSAVGKAVAIGPNLWLSADHVIRDDQSSLGTVLAVDRKYDRCLIQGPATSWSEVRREPVRPGETLYFEGGTVRVQPDLSFQVASGRAISGMSGGPIWDAEGYIVSVVSEGEGNGDGRLWGYLGLAEWVDSVRGVPNAPPVVEVSATCECGPDCDCVDCQCGAVAAAPPTRELVVIGAEWCGPCQSVKAAMGDLANVRYIDLDHERQAAVEAFGGQPAEVPSYALLVGGERVMRWSGGTDRAGLERMRDWETQ